ncbi:MAG: hypothetical protein LBR67_10190 [Dysgonamonadaceae bacterium]|jgi:hypothetical protein|nr:hypothetical protein [Dysgonamonadaceae bacterium]
MVRLFDSIKIAPLAVFFLILCLCITPFHRSKAQTQEEILRMFSSMAPAQQPLREFSGVVVDSVSNKPLEGAVVSLVDSHQTGSLVVNNRITNVKGEFVFSDLANMILTQKHYEVACLGYKVKSGPLVATGEKLHLRIMLAPDVQQLDEVVVSARMAMYRVKGDTTIFFPAAVKTLEGDPVLEVLRQMPGVEVYGDGSVIIDGKRVERSYVNGRLIFGADPREAVKQIEAKDAAQILAYDEPDEKEAHLYGKDAARKRKVLNIITFNTFDQVASGNLQAEAGVAEDQELNRYLAAADVGLFNEKRQIKLSGGLDNFVPTERQIGRQDHQKLGASLTSTIPTGNYGLNYAFSNNASSSETRSNTLYFPTGQFQTQTMDRLNSGSDHSYQHNVNGNFYKQVGKNTVNGTFGLSLQQSDGVSVSSSELLRDGMLLTGINSRSAFDRKNVSLNGHISFTKKLEKQRTLRFDLDADGAGGKQHRVHSNNISEGVLPQRHEALLFTSESPKLKLSAEANYNINRFSMLGRLFMINYMLKATPEWQTDRQTATDSLTAVRDDGRSADNQTRLIGIKGGIKLTRMKERDGVLTNDLDLDLGYNTVFFHRTERLPSIMEQRRIFSNPEFAVSYRNNEWLSCSFRVAMSLPPSTQFSTRIDDSNPLMLTTGNSGLNPALSYHANIVYSRREQSGDSWFQISMRASFTDGQVVDNRIYFAEPTVLPEYNNYLTVAGATLMAPMNGTANWSVSPNTSFEKRLNFIKSILKAGLGYTWSSNQTGINSELVKNHEQRVNNSVSLTTNFSSKFRASLENNLTYRDFENYTARKDTRVTDDLKFTARWDFTERFFALSSYTMAHNSSSASDVTITDHVINASLGVRLFKNRRGSLSINAYDILNRSTNFTTSINDQYILNTWKQLYSQYFTVAFSYRFAAQGSMGSLQNMLGM